MKSTKSLNGILTLLVVFMSIIVMSGCANNVEDNNEFIPPQTDVIVITDDGNEKPTSNNIMNDEVVNVDDSAATKSGIDQIVAANNKFAFDLYERYREKDGNIFFSPYSMTSSLAMTYEGAEGMTENEIRDTFYFPDDENLMRSSYASLYNDYNKDNGEYELNVANALFAEKTYSFLGTYLTVIRSYYGGKVTNLDFINYAEQSRLVINEWVEKQTNNKITDLLPKRSVDSDTKLVLVNAIYFKGDWNLEFDEELTRWDDFYLEDGTSIKVDMMNSTTKDSKYEYTEDDNFQILNLEYKGDDISMLMFLPQEGKTIEDVEDAFSPELIASSMQRMYERRVDVFMPRFKMEEEYFMKTDLLNMGMPSAFGGNADFSGMDGSKNIYIGEVIHKSFIEVDEKGTEAAAATAVITKASGMPMPIPEFKVNKPFLFTIVDKNTGNILFLGRVENPLG